MTKFTFLPFRSNYSCLFSHFNVALAITKLWKHWCMVAIVLWTAWANLFPALHCWEKQCGDKFEQKGSLQCIVFSNLVKHNIHLKKIICFVKSYQPIKLIFQFKYGKVKYQLVFLWLLTTLTDNSRSVETFLFPVRYFTMDLRNNNKSVEA